ncbi:flagellar biosynthesis protein FlhF [Pseudobdellovibrio sp. HCB154]|uniref:flagellar biosynthesis protein FlhF n=1 Tax=Pseudobdellovibrio sp. HCB154 TaxID=3386277 RepID=UPI003916D517
MQIKKFEARSMKEALELVKTQLGPDAVILSAKEVTKGFGLGGEKSIEITAAYSENVLQHKKYVESKLPEHLKEKFSKAPARTQKETMQKSIESRLKLMQAEETRKKPVIPVTMTQRRYADIDNEDTVPAPVETSIKYNPTPKLTQQAQATFNNLEVDQLKSEIDQLKNLLGQFKQMPQGFVQAHPGAEHGVNYNLSSHYTALTRKGLLPEVAAEILTQAQTQLTPDKQNNKAVVEAYIARFILKTVPVAQENFEQFHLFMGPSGSGKTSTMIKYASDLVLNHKKRVALISTDTIKIGADEQMKIFAQILNLPFIAIRSEADWFKILPYLNQVDHVLVDFASLNLKAADELRYIKKMMPPTTESVRTHLVLSAMSKDADLLEVHRRYQALNVSDVVFTSLDEASMHGNIYNFVQKTGAPLFGFGIGSRTPEDFERATAERVLDLILNITGTRTESGINL